MDYSKIQADLRRLLPMKIRQTKWYCEDMGFGMLQKVEIISYCPGLSESEQGAVLSEIKKHGKWEVTFTTAPRPFRPRSNAWC